MEIYFEINGVRRDISQIKGQIEKAIYQNVKQQIISKLSNVKDPETGETPKIIVKGSSLNNLSFDVVGSETLIRMVRKLF